MNVENLYWWFGLIGNIASVIGLPVAIWQIRKTRLAAEAAKDALIQTQKVISRNLILSDISTCTRNIEEIKFFVRIERFESAQIRITDLISQMVQVREILESSNQIHHVEFEITLSQLSLIRQNLERKLMKNSVKLDVVQVNSQLSKISDELHKLIGEMKVAVEQGE